MLVTNLNSLAIGEPAVITWLTAEGSLQQRLFTLGLHPGRQVSVIRKAGFSGPLHLRISTTEMMLRRREAQQVYVVSIEPEYDATSNSIELRKNKVPARNSISLRIQGLMGTLSNRKAPNLNLLT